MAEIRVELLPEPSWAAPSWNGADLCCPEPSGGNNISRPSRTDARSSLRIFTRCVCECVCLELKTPSPPLPELEISFCSGKQRHLQYLNICHFLAGTFLRGCLTGSRQTESEPTKQLNKETIAENSNEPTHTKWLGRTILPSLTACSQPFFSLPSGSDGYQGAELLRGGSFVLPGSQKRTLFIYFLFLIVNLCYFTAMTSTGFSLGRFQYFRC